VLRARFRAWSMGRCDKVIGDTPEVIPFRRVPV
jgi:hypothetical protein